MAAGFEYTLVGVLNTRSDLGILGEYLYDSRSNDASPFDNDLFVGLRWAANNISGNSVLLEVIVDLENKGWMLYTEATARLTDRLSLETELRLFTISSRHDPLYDLREDDYLGVTLEYHL